MDRTYSSQIFDSFLNNAHWHKARRCFDGLLGHPVWWVIEPSAKKVRLLAQPAKATPSCLPLSQEGNEHLSLFIQKTLKDMAGDLKQSNCCCFPSWPSWLYVLRKGRNFCGAIFVCHIRENILKDKKIAGLFKITIDSILEEIQKQFELNRLYETLQPRAIALSTVHTIHRIIGSTMTLNELLPKVARLSLQILKAKACSILLYDEQKNKLVPRVSLGTRQKEIELGEGVAGQVAETGSYYRRDNILSVPLMNGEFLGCIVVYERLDKKPFSISDQEILFTLAEQATIAVENARLYEEQQKMLAGSVKSMVKMLEFISPRTYTHSGRFINLVMAIAEKLALTSEEMSTIHYAAVLHDAGTVGLSKRILKKTEGLSPAEAEAIRRHPASGASIIEPIGILKPIIPLVRHHHERYDGRGYPDGLKGDMIPLGARIMALADTFEAMISKRSYRGKKPIDVALAEIKKCSGTQFDPRIVHIFVGLYEKGILEQVMKTKKVSAG